MHKLYVYMCFPVCVSLLSKPMYKRHLAPPNNIHANDGCHWGPWRTPSCRSSVSRNVKSPNATKAPVDSADRMSWIRCLKADDSLTREASPCRAEGTCETLRVWRAFLLKQMCLKRIPTVLLQLVGRPVLPLSLHATLGEKKAQENHVCSFSDTAKL